MSTFAMFVLVLVFSNGDEVIGPKPVTYEVCRATVEQLYSGRIAFFDRTGHPQTVVEAACVLEINL
jgi:hypothetical protein